MKLNRLFSSLALVLSVQATAATVAVIDSGVDYKHRDLAAKIWANPNSSSQDADGIVYSQDTHGWNFAENNNQIIDYQYLGTFSADYPKFFDIQGKTLLGTATEAEKLWYQQRRADTEFVKQLGKFGNFVHGTHVSGISAVGLLTSKIAGIKLIPTVTPGQMVQEAEAFAAAHPEWSDLKASSANNPIALAFLKMSAGRQAGLLIKAGKYTAAILATVANGSFGTSVKAAQPIVAQMLKSLIGHDPTEQESRDYTIYFVNEIAAAAKGFPQASPKTLFVFAAGNDGTNNDELPASPANIKLDNTIAVAATVGVEKLASFSNFGAQMVEVAAPGVVINSTIPGDGYMTLSGTSMAAPFVTSVAAQVTEANPALTARQVKQVIMSTVDVKEWLQGKVSTSGIVNAERAVHAALNSLRLPLVDAVEQALLEVADVEADNKSLGMDDRDLFVLPLPGTF